MRQPRPMGQAGRASRAIKESTEACVAIELPANAFLTARLRAGLGVYAGLSSVREKLRRDRDAAARLPRARRRSMEMRARVSERCRALQPHRGASRMRIWTLPAIVGNAIAAIVRPASSASPSMSRSNGYLTNSLLWLRLGLRSRLPSRGRGLPGRRCSGERLLRRRFHTERGGSAIAGMRMSAKRACRCSCRRTRTSTIREAGGIAIGPFAGSAIVASYPSRAGRAIIVRS